MFEAQVVCLLVFYVVFTSVRSGPRGVTWRLQCFCIVFTHISNANVPFRCASESHNFTFAHNFNQIATFTGARFEVGGLPGIQTRRFPDTQLQIPIIPDQNGSGTQNVPKVRNI